MFYNACKEYSEKGAGNIVFAMYFGAIAIDANFLLIYTIFIIFLKQR